jgi:uncharacterized protein (TIGR00369 family)
MDPRNLPGALLPYERTMAGPLGIEIIPVAVGEIRGRMPVTDIVRQPYGVLHGGAIAVLAETITSVGTCMGIDLSREIGFGQEINYSLLRTVMGGHVTAEARTLHRGRTAWVWDVRVHDDAEKLVAVVRCTIAVRPQRA